MEVGTINDTSTTVTALLDWGAFLLYNILIVNQTND